MRRSERLLALIVLLLAMTLAVRVVPAPFVDCQGGECRPTWWPGTADNIVWFRPQPSLVLPEH